MTHQEGSAYDMLWVIVEENRENSEIKEELILVVKTVAQLRIG